MNCFIIPHKQHLLNMSTHNFLGLLDLKVDATIGLDGQLIMLKTNDFVGISGVDHGFHLVSIRPHPNASIVVGFLVFGDIPLIRKYDPQTEEVSSQEVDEMSTRNLLEQVRNGQLPAASVLDYKNIVSNDQMIQWRDQTKFILSSKILGRRGIQNGDKVIPGSYNDDDTSTLSLSKVYTDGKSVKYPSIPVVDTTISLKSNRHAGTRRYLTTLSPSERTQLFMESKIAGRLLRDILKLYFEDSWETLLGDLQLAYILFLYLQCLASLEHWYVCGRHASGGTCCHHYSIAHLHCVVGSRKDLVAMLSLVEGSEMKDFPQLYHALLEVLPSQLSSMDKGFLEVRVPTH